MYKTKDRTKIKNENYEYINYDKNLLAIYVNM